MNIVFVTPPSGFLLDERVFPSLGILKVAASCISAGHEVDHWDFSGVPTYVEECRARCLRTEARLFALTATTPQMPAAIKITSTIREVLPNAKIILGGPHATLVNAAAKGERARGFVGRGVAALVRLTETYDTVVAGDGENAIHQAIQGAVEGSSESAVLQRLQDRDGSLRPKDGRNEQNDLCVHQSASDRLIDADDPKSTLWLTSQGFTDSPWPARHLIDLNSYHYEIDGERAAHCVAQLGCPFACGFCGGRESYMLRRIRLRSTDNVVAEMENLHQQYGYRAMMLNDDELNVNTQMIPLMLAIKALGNKYGFQWKLRGFVKAELFTDEQAEAMHAAGFRWLLCGFESAHPRILHNINKKATLEDNTRMLRIAHKHGLKVKALMSLGHPGESEETIHATRDWLLAEKPDDFDATCITLYPGTPYWDHSVRVGADDVYRYQYAGDNLYSMDVDFLREQAFYKGIPGHYRSFVWTDSLTPERLVELRDSVESEVREKLKLPYPQGPAKHIESSMGQRSSA